MKALLLKFFHSLRQSFQDLIPIILVIGFFQLVVLNQGVPNIWQILSGGLMVLVGLTLFVLGLQMALFPLGEEMAYSFVKKGNLWLLLLFSFTLGFGTTVAEPALIAIADEAASIAATGGVIEEHRCGARQLRHRTEAGRCTGGRLCHIGGCHPDTERMAGAIPDHWRLPGRGDHDLFRACGNHRHRLRFRRRDHLHGNRAAGCGAGYRAGEKYPGPRPDDRRIRPDRLCFAHPDDFCHGLRHVFLAHSMEELLHFGKTVISLLRDVLPIAGILLGFQVLILRRPIPNPSAVFIGLLFVLIGLAFFLEGLELALFPLGRLMAEQLTSPAFVLGADAAAIAEFVWTDYFWVYVFAAAIGFATTIAEPALIAVSIKANQVSGGTITVNGLRFAVAIGVAAGVALGAFRIVTGTPLHWYIITGYIIVIIQTAFAPQGDYSARLRFRRRHHFHSYCSAGCSPGPGAGGNHTRPQPVDGRFRPDCICQSFPDDLGDGVCATQ